MGRLALITTAASLSVFLVSFSGCGKTEVPAGPATATPTPIATFVIDDFEDGDTVNNVTKTAGVNGWSASAVGTGIMAGFGISGGAGGAYGSYCLSVSGTAMANSNGYLSLSANTSSDIVNAGSDLSGHKNISFSAALISDAPADVTHTCRIAATVWQDPVHATMMSKSQVLIADGQWHDYTLDLSTFTFVSGETADSVMSRVTYLMFQFKISSSNPVQTANLQGFIDNVKLEK